MLWAPQLIYAGLELAYLSLISLIVYVYMYIFHIRALHNSSVIYILDICVLISRGCTTRYSFVHRLVFYQFFIICQIFSTTKGCNNRMQYAHDTVVIHFWLYIMNSRMVIVVYQPYLWKTRIWQETELVYAVRGHLDRSKAHVELNVFLLTGCVETIRMLMSFAHILCIWCVIHQTCFYSTTIWFPFTRMYNRTLVPRITTNS